MNLAPRDGLSVAKILYVPHDEAEYERPHVKQIEQIMNTMRRWG